MQTSIQMSVLYLPLEVGLRQEGDDRVWRENFIECRLPRETTFGPGDVISACNGYTGFQTAVRTNALLVIGMLMLKQI